MIRNPAHWAIHRHRLVALRAYPLLCVLQAPTRGGDIRIVAPLGPRGLTGAAASPALMLDGQRHAVLLRQMTHVPLRVFLEEVGSAEAIRDDIARGLDLLFFGV